jgi:hypothetical protein
MIEIREILTVSFIKICLAQLAEMKRRYRDKAWMGIILRFADVELRETNAAILDSTYYPENKDRIDMEFYSLVCEMKSHILPADYLFLKSFFTKDDNDRLFFLQQAQMIEPENLRLHMMSTFLAPDAEEYPEAVIRHLNSLVKPLDSTEVFDFACLIYIIWAISNSVSEIRPADVAQFISESAFHVKVKCSLLYHMVRRIDAVAGKVLLDSIDIPDCNENREYLLARMHVHYELKEFLRAGEWLRKIEANHRIFEWDLKLECLYKETVILRHSGKEGEAIMLLQKILLSGDFDCNSTDFYYLAIVDLTGYFIKINQPEKADMVLSLVPDNMFYYVESLGGDAYRLMMAEKAIQEADFESALHFYQKTSPENTSPEIKERIRKLKGLAQ